MDPHTRLPADPRSPRARLAAVSRPIVEINTLAELVALGGRLDGVALQGIVVPPGLIDWAAADVAGLTLLGVRFEDPAEEATARARGALVFPRFPDRPYDAYRTTLYTEDELNAVVHSGSGTLDAAIYRHYEDAGRDHPDVVESLAQRIHDHAIDDALSELLETIDRPIVGIMGGHNLSRADPLFALTAELARRLTLNGFIVATGGGPGAMEAANLGGLCGRLDADGLAELVAGLADAPHWQDEAWGDVATQVRAGIASGSTTLGLPTWFYGHEPTNRFATHIAKYFSNSVREDRLLALANGGVVFTPGGPGTVQEVFQDAAQNIYETFGPAAPMVFLGAEEWDRSGVVPLISTMAAKKRTSVSITVTDDLDVVVEAMLAGMT
ncbi:MAG: hypothetical protein KAZ88_02320 [Acidimicrobiia bacterium]|nr:hypothetical protein [Acidimicrobiia bacterium]MBP8179810.1 hypothetical protein [Acidimicrobiia bacterium]